MIVETEYEPAHTVEDDARSRLGMVMAGSGDAVEQAIAIRVPDALRGDQGRLAENIATAEFHYCVFTHREGEPHDPLRWPERGWLSGGIDDFAGLIEQTALSERRIAEGMRILEEGVSQAAARLRSDLEHDRPGVLAQIAEALHQEGGEQTSRMAMAIVANALTVHTSIAGAHDIPPLDELRGARGQLLKTRVLATWRRILHEINYWPIFRIASDVLLPIPNGTAGAVLERLHAVAAELDGIGVTSTQDLAGQMFGRLITDRKFLATFYTLPSSAALLAELAVSRLDVDWPDAEAVKALRIADLACGTGVLLSAAYRAVAARHRRASGDDEALHREMMEHALIGADIMPAATHLTASMLSSAHPDRDVWQHAGLHDAVRQAGRGSWRRHRHRVARPHRERHDAGLVHHRATGSARYGSRRGGRGLPGACAAHRHCRPRDNESALHTTDESRGHLRGTGAIVRGIRDD